MLEGHMIDALIYTCESRLASRIYKKLYSDIIESQDDLYQFMKNIKWWAIMNLDQTFKFEAYQFLRETPFQEEFQNTLYLCQLAKDGLSDAFRSKFKERPFVGKEHPDFFFRLELYPFKNKVMASLMVDMTGHSLSHRGYRTKAHRAGLRENLAAGLLTTHPNLDATSGLWDPMCGGATLIIEALIQKLKLPAQYLKMLKLKLDLDLDLENTISSPKLDEPTSIPNQPAYSLFSCFKHLYLSKDPQTLKRFAQYLEKRQKEILKALNSGDTHRATYYASDIDTKSLALAEENLKAAKLEKFVTLFHDDFFRPTHAPKKIDLIISNPPYGERLNLDNQSHFYYQIGEQVKNHHSTDLILISEKENLKAIRLKATRKLKLFNAKIETFAYFYPKNL